MHLERRERAPKPPMQLEELQSIVDDLERYDAEHRKQMQLVEYDGEEAAELEGRRDERLVQLRDRLVNEKERFSKVFETEKGSTYFQLDTGESFRIKKLDPQPWKTVQEQYRWQPVEAALFFVPPERAVDFDEEIYNAWEQSGAIVTSTVATSQYSEGVSPVELHVHPDQGWEINVDDTVLRVSAPVKPLGDFPHPVIHPGHPITKIYK